MISEVDRRLRGDVTDVFTGVGNPRVADLKDFPRLFAPSRKTESGFVGVFPPSLSPKKDPIVVALFPNDVLVFRELVDLTNKLDSFAFIDCRRRRFVVEARRRLARTFPTASKVKTCN